jgi:cytochrome P460
MRSILAILTISILFSSCSKDKDRNFTIPKDYRSWEKPVKKVLDYQITGHGNSFRIMYANEISYTAKRIKAKNGNWKVIMPEGSVIIKEMYNKRKDINKKDPTCTIMVKGKKGDPDFGWSYYMKKPGNKIMKVESKMCIGCHEAANERHPYFDKNKEGIFRDFLFVSFVR